MGGAGLPQCKLIIADRVAVPEYLVFCESEYLVFCESQGRWSSRA
jgi:hypothetical protein